ncbi:MAG: crotonase/enoyl-CoA hydratase family protein [Parvibaculum sp.]|uniref:crotonase/enoyl-CoA hydratase family protein n=1 Tax=Parvibaculum sp. TaxID=2024848 RepID=UPI0027190E8F|nr:crotonase/enoyl-CoA hydratase family protein [Parvibaculum sp.]MDO8839586.1 crotonase/enoyl-CoA hydratase family protein [Parvibaculum sp.]
MSTSILNYSIENDIATLAMDDGKANALGHAMIGEINAALDRAQNEAKAVLIAGRDKRFCAGFDLEVMASGPDNVRKLVGAGAELLMRLYEYRLPVVMACTGHALAAGGLLLLAADARIGAAGAFKIGLPEVAIGMTLPIFGIELARDRLARNRFSEAVTQARIYGPDEAVAVGYLDETAAPEALIETASARAATLAALAQPAFANTKRKERAATIAHIRETLEADSGSFDGAKKG